MQRNKTIGGYHLASDIEIVNCVSPSVSTIGATWCQSKLTINGTAYAVNNV